MNTESSPQDSSGTIFGNILPTQNASTDSFSLPQHSEIFSKESHIALVQTPDSPPTGAQISTIQFNHNPFETPTESTSSYPSTAPPLSPISHTSYTGYVYDPSLLLHKNEVSDHPENPSRILKIHEQLIQTGLAKKLVHVPLRSATQTEMELVHEQDYLNWMSSTSSKLPEEYERQSIYYNEYTASCAQRSCGGVLEMVQYISSGLLRNGMAMVRPPGHHAECNRAMGFCFLNYVAIAARYLQKYCLNMKKILILDWDIHHGNGTQNIFFSDPSVLYISIHRYDHGDFFPNYEDADYTYTGAGPGTGKTVNIPWSDDEMGDAEYLYAFHHVILPIAYEFNPDFILVSCGFDAAEGDPLGCYHVSPACYGHMTHALMALAQGRLVLSLEGGYSLEALPTCAEMCMRALLGEPPQPLVVPLCPNPSAYYTINQLVIPTQRKHWTCFGTDSGQEDALFHYRSRYPHMFVLDTTVHTRFWSGLLTEHYGLIRMPMPDSLSSSLHMAPDILLQQSNLIVLIHNISFSASSTKDEQKAFPHLVYLDRAVSKKFHVVDLAIHDTNDPQQSIMYLWNNYLRLGISKHIYIIGFGTVCSNMIVSLVSKSDIKYINACFLFPEELIKPVPYERAAWFYDHSCVFVSGPEEIGVSLPFSRSFGHCVSSGPGLSGPLSGFNCLSHVDRVFQHIT